MGLFLDEHGNGWDQCSDICFGPTSYFNFFTHVVLVLPSCGAGALGNMSSCLRITLGTAYAAYIARLTRGGMLEVIRSDFIRTAHAKGLRERMVIWRHALKGGIGPRGHVFRAGYCKLDGRKCCCRKDF